MATRKISSLFVLSAAALASAQLLGETPSVVHKDRRELSLRDLRALAVKTPRPDYPLVARNNHWTGSGVAVLEVDDQTGTVTSAQMAVSTGRQVLDDAAIAAFRHWRFQPGTVKKVKVPITFMISSGQFLAGPLRRTVPLPTDHPVKIHSATRGPDGVAIYTPAPDYPAAARSHHVSGNGVAIVTVDGKTGAVTEARMNPSTGHAELDSAALTAFRRWRFKPGTSGDYKIPVTYKL